MRCFKLICLGMIILLLPDDLVGQDKEKFRLNSGEPFEAELVSWDFQTGQLSLKKTDGTIIEVPASDLQLADMKLIEKTLKKQLLAGKKGQQSATANKSTTNKLIGKESKGGDSWGQADRLNGVLWYDNEQDAKRVASGSDGTRDDRPIVWFRVLGDMKGFM